ncbi:MAG TPA: hypothetical protein VKB28_18240 [Solirubrobacteraceae bacterium]|nr:hypothetical protein [Solirubrobacteraceae bacterium]
MRIKAVLPAALAIGLVMTPAALADSGSAKSHPVPAKAAGSDGPPPVLPSIVRTRIARGTKAIERAGDWVDQEDNAKAVVSLRNVRRNMYAAWRGAVDVVENAPPPPPPGGDLQRVVRVHNRVAAHTSATYLSPEETAVAVLNFQHDVAGAAYGLLDGAKGALRDAVSTTIFAALNRRDQAAVYIHGRPVPPPPPPDLARASANPHAHAADEDGPPTFAALMPGVVPDLDDELAQTKGLLRGGALTPGEKRIMGQARAQVLETKDQINTWWPPLPADD